MWGPLILKILFKVSETTSVVKSQRSCLLFPQVREALLNTARSLACVSWTRLKRQNPRD